MSPTELRRQHNDTTTEAAVVADLAFAAQEVQTVNVGGIEVFALPDGVKIDSLDQYRDAPLRHKGIQHVADVPSFLKLLNHYSSQNRMVRLSQDKLLVECVCNFGTSEEPEWQDHSIKWQLSLDKKLKAWRDLDGKPQSQSSFMEFLEDRLSDVVQNPNPATAVGLPAGPSQSELQSVIGDLKLTTDSNFRSTKNLHNGNHVFETNSTTTPSVEVPTMFYLGLPIFDGARDRHVIPVRMRYRVIEGKLTFTLLFHDWKTVLDNAWKMVTDDVTKELPENVDYINVP